MDVMRAKAIMEEVGLEGLVRQTTDTVILELIFNDIFSFLSISLTIKHH
jgi:hypothetical protein